MKRLILTNTPAKRMGLLLAAFSLSVIIFYSVHWYMEIRRRYEDFDDYLEYFLDHKIGTGAAILFLFGILLLTGIFEKTYLWIRTGNWEIEQNEKNKAFGTAVTSGEKKNIITALNSSNGFTLTDGLARFFLKDLGEVAEQTIDPKIKKDYENIKKYLGAEESNLTKQQEDHFVKLFEQYLFNGRAPKAELQATFDTYKKSVRDQNLILPPEIQKAFDRMLGG